MVSNTMIYLRPTTGDTTRFRVSQPPKQNHILITIDGNEEINDIFNGIELKWKLVALVKSEPCRFELSFDKKHKDVILNSYLPYVLEKSKEMKEELKTLKLSTPKGGRVYRPSGGMDVWRSVNFDHPSTFKTLAMDFEVKKLIMEDLERFVKGREYYRKVGRAWKRGYLLFGPPGTGKTSLVAAMANYLKFDVYDLELMKVRSNLELKRLVTFMANRSILVVDDVDRSVALQTRCGNAMYNRNFRSSNQKNQRPVRDFSSSFSCLPRPRSKPAIQACNSFSGPQSKCAIQARDPRPVFAAPASLQLPRANFGSNSNPAT